MSETARARLERLLQSLHDSAESERASPSRHHGGTEEDVHEAPAGELTERDGGATAFASLEQHYKRRIASLEQRVTELAAENAKVVALHRNDSRAKDGLIQDLQRQVVQEMAEVRQRQQEVEQMAPVLSQQMAQAKEQLGESVLSDAAYAELMAKPAHQRSLADEVRIVTYEGLSRLKHENEQLRVSSQANRDAFLAIEHDLNALKRENARLKTQAADAVAQAAQDVEAMAARHERLQHCLDQAVMAAELSHAKAQLYDELALHANQLEAQNARLAGVEAARAALEGELAAVQSTYKEREHRLEMLMMDKAYLSREVDSLEGRLLRVTEERDQLSAAVEDLKRQQKELYDKLLLTEDSSKASLERRVEMEVSRIQSQALADLEKLRAESKGALERETRILRDMRDAALAESDRAKAELKAARAGHEELLLRHRELQRRADLEASRLSADLQIRAGEADRRTVELAEKESMLARAQQQLDMMHDKVRVLTDNYYALDSERARRVAELQSRLDAALEQVTHYQRIEADIDKAVLAESDAGDSTLLKSIGNVVPLSIKRRVQQSLALAARCGSLESERTALAREKEDLQQALHSAQLELAKYEQLSARSGPGPNTYLLEQLAAAELKAATAEGKAARLTEQLTRRDAELAEQRQKLKQMQRDLQVVLEQRSLLDSLKSALQRGSAAG